MTAGVVVQLTSPSISVDDGVIFPSGMRARIIRYPQRWIVRRPIIVYRALSRETSNLKSGASTKPEILLEIKLRSILRSLLLQTIE